MPSQNFTLTPEQIALSEERKRRKANASLVLATTTPGPASLAMEGIKILGRQWLTRTLSDLPIAEQKITLLKSITVMTWNVLAQCLIRRELFPHSDCLKAQQRQGMLQEEIRRSGAQIICLQEVDRIETMAPFLLSLGYGYTYSTGPKKKHGCLIAYRSEVFSKVTEHTVYYDDYEVRSEGSTEAYRRGSSFRTKNIALIVALKNAASDETVTVATTHLFWHPKYAYERARQAYILLQSVKDFEAQRGPVSPLSIIAGDFNFTPADPAYALLVGDSLRPEQAAVISISRVVHVTIDPSISLENPNKMKIDEEGGEQQEEEDPDRAIKNARPAKLEDGLLDVHELEALFAGKNADGPLQSVYDNWPSPKPGRSFASSSPDATSRLGGNEPAFTSYTHYWKSTLDYIFVLHQREVNFEVVSILEPPTAEELDTGIPKKGVCGSDHISLCAEIALIPSDVERRQRALYTPPPAEI